MEVTSRVRKAAAEALMEAQEKLRAAEEVQAHLRQQLEDAMQLQQVWGWCGVVWCGVGEGGGQQVLGGMRGWRGAGAGNHWMQCSCSRGTCQRMKSKGISVHRSFK